MFRQMISVRGVHGFRASCPLHMKYQAGCKIGRSGIRCLNGRLHLHYKTVMSLLPYEEHDWN